MVDACIRWTRGMRASKEVATRIATLYQGTSLPQSQSHPREYATPAALVTSSASHSATAADRAMFSSALEPSIDAYWNIEVAFTRSFDAHLQSQFQPGLTKLLLRSDVTADDALVRNAASHSHAGMLDWVAHPTSSHGVCLYFLGWFKSRLCPSSRLVSSSHQNTPTRRTRRLRPRFRASNPCLSPASCRTWTRIAS